MSPRVVSILLALVACGHDQTTTPGETGELTTNGSSVSVGDDGGDSSTTAVGEASTSDSGVTSADTGVTSADTGGAEIYCTTDTEGCVCGHTADYGPLGASCSTSTVGSPSMCCGTQGWPAYGGCSCWTLSCRQLSGGDTCYCGIGNVDPADGDVAVGSCTPNGGICCRDLSGLSCACWTDLTVCLDGYEQVESCGVETVTCGEDSSTLVACN